MGSVVSLIDLALQVVEPHRIPSLKHVTMCLLIVMFFLSLSHCIHSSLNIPVCLLSDFSRSAAYCPTESLAGEGMP